MTKQNDPGKPPVWIIILVLIGLILGLWLSCRKEQPRPDLLPADWHKKPVLDSDKLKTQ